MGLEEEQWNQKCPHVSSPKPHPQFVIQRLCRLQRQRQRRDDEGWKVHPRTWPSFVSDFCSMFFFVGAEKKTTRVTPAGSCCNFCATAWLPPHVWPMISIIQWLFSLLPKLCLRSVRWHRSGRLCYSTYMMLVRPEIHASSNPLLQENGLYMMHLGHTGTYCSPLQKGRFRRRQVAMFSMDWRKCISCFNNVKEGIRKMTSSTFMAFHSAGELLVNKETGKGRSQWHQSFRKIKKKSFLFHTSTSKLSHLTFLMC